MIISRRLHRILTRTLWLVAATVTTGCASTTTFQNPSLSRVPGAATVLIMQPDVQLSELTAAGLEQPNAQWTAQGLANVKRALTESLAGRPVSLVQYKEPDADSAQAHAHAQLLKLHEAVGSTILTHKYNQAMSLPSKAGIFDYTLGAGTQVLREHYSADHALFLYLHDSYASGGRVAVMIAMAALGVGVQGGVQRGFASLVDLQTGDISWFNVLVSGAGDLRTIEPTKAAVASLLGNIPL